MDRKSSEDPQHDDRRMALRQRCRVATLVVEHENAGIVTARVLDISRQGFRLQMPLSVPCGDGIVIHPPSGFNLLKIRATIVRQSIVTRDSVRFFECGVEVADTAAWRKHSWFLALRVSSEDADGPEQTVPVQASAA